MFSLIGWSAILTRFGIVAETISREEAAQELLQREVRFMWKPVIVEESVVRGP